MIYRRTFDPDSGDSLARLARWVRPGATVLELGAAAGYFTEWLQSQGCVVDVLEIDPEAAREARPFARRVVVTDLDADGWEGKLADEPSAARYDFIVCADVLEHLRDGARLLARLRQLLAPDGELLLSVPNVAHAAIIAGLFDDRFDYGGEGLLDPTHLRLYTWRSLASALSRTGFRILAWDATELTPYASEFRVRVEALSPELRAALGPGSRHSAYQWLVRAAPGPMDSIPVPPAGSGGERVPIRLLQGPSRDVLSLETAERGFIPANGEAATLEWRFAPGHNALRLLLADRIGVIRIAEFALFAGEHEVWRRGADGDALNAGPDAIALGEPADTYALVRADAWIEPRIEAEAAARVDRVRVTLAWTGDWTGSAAFAALTGLAGVVVTRSAQAHREIARLNSAMDERDATLGARDAALAAGAAERARMDASLVAQQQIILRQQGFSWWLAMPFRRLKRLLVRG
ncbi:MAG: class I SAM-dependent methyltransferase [Betaproteobacteria bacterium]